MFGILFTKMPEPFFDSPVCRFIEIGARAAGWATVLAAFAGGFLTRYLVAG